MAHPIVLKGEFDISNVDELRRKLTKAEHAGNDDIVIDMRSVTYMDSSSLGTLAAFRKQIHPTGRRITLLIENPQLLRIFRITSLDKSFEIVSDSGTTS
ncbi:MAG: STAS domain-containing protein [Candidatus Eremiobacteraeota bacterium]|nr:STAS domain-containing protein [Candidatus Eremiobacteraeota bacterium]